MDPTTARDLALATLARLRETSANHDAALDGLHGPGPDGDDPSCLGGDHLLSLLQQVHDLAAEAACRSAQLCNAIGLRRTAECDAGDQAELPQAWEPAAFEARKPGRPRKAKRRRR